MEAIKEIHGQLAIRRKEREEMNRKRKRITAYLLTVCMVVTALVLPGAGSKVKAVSETVLKEYVPEISEYRKNENTYEPKEGYVFAGWYEDEACETTPLNKETKSGGAYAKYVPEQIMNVQAQISINLRDSDPNNDGNGSIRFVSTVDSDNYSKVGFRFVIGDGEAIERDITTVYNHIYVNEAGGTTDRCTPAMVGCSMSKYFVTWGFWNIPESAFQTSIKATPYWETLDGTMVYGAEKEKTVHEGIFGTIWGDVSGMSYNAQADQYNSGAAQGPYLYSKPVVGNIGVSATIEKPETGNSNAGITVRVGEQSRQFMSNADNALVYCENSEYRSAPVMDGYQFYDENGKASVKGLVKDGFFYFFFGEEQILCKPMKELFGENYSQESSEVEIGFTSFWSIVGFEDLKCLSSDEVAKVETVEYVNFQYNKITDEYTMNGLAYLYGKKATGNVGVSATLEITSAGNNNAGIAVRVGNESKQYMLNSQNQLVESRNSAEFVGAPTMEGYTFYNASGVASVKGLVKDGFFYLFSGEEQILCKKMTELFSGYDKDSSQVEIGLAGWDSSAVKFCNVTYLSSDEAAKVETMEYVNFQYNKTANEFIMLDWNKVAYLYGKKATGNVGVSTKLVIKDGVNSNAGITVRVGNQSKQYMLNAGNELVEGSNSANLNGAERKEGCTFYVDGTASVKGLVKDGYFYLLSGEEEILCKPMKELFGDAYSQDSSEVEIGLCGWCSTGVKFCEVRYLSPDEVANALPKSANFNYNESTNEYTMKAASAYCYDKKVIGNVSVSATLVEVSDGGNGNTNAGITVRVGGQSKQFMLNKGNELVKGTNSVGLDGVEHKEEYTFYENGMAHIKGVVKDGVLSFYSGDVEILHENMVNLFPHYDKDSSQVEIGLCGWHSTGVKFTNVEYLFAEDVN